MTEDISKLTQRLRFHRAANSSYRPIQSVEIDEVLVHDQSFPISEPLQSSGLVVHWERHGLDRVLITDECFPCPTSETRETRSLDRSTHGSNAQGQNSTTGNLELPVRQEHKIRGLDILTGWYTTKATNAVASPPSGLYAQTGDLFVHFFGEGEIQVWMWNDDCWQGNVQDGHQHPTLGGHRLHVRAGAAPTWVTKKTLTTYQGRARSSRR